jgi:hypothetical protein
MTLARAHAPPNAKYQHRGATIWLFVVLRDPVWGSPQFGDRMPLPTACRSAWSVGRAGGAGGLAAWVSARGFPTTGCRSLVRGIRLVLLRASDVESNPRPDGGPCVSCGLPSTSDKRALLRCREGCGRESHRKEACSGLRRGEQPQGISACGVCVVVSGGVAPHQPQSSQVPPPAAFSRPFGHPGSLPSQTGSNSQTKLHHLGVGGGCWPWRWPWCWNWGFPPTST